MAKQILFGAVSVLSQTRKCLVLLVIHLFYEKDRRPRDFCGNDSLYKQGKPPQTKYVNLLSSKYFQQPFKVKNKGNIPEWSFLSLKSTPKFWKPWLLNINPKEFPSSHLEMQLKFMLTLTESCVCVCVFSRVWLCHPMDCSQPGSPVHGIFISYSRGLPDPGIEPGSPALAGGDTSETLTEA